MPLPRRVAGRVIGFDVAVLQGVEDHWSAKAELTRLDSAKKLPLGIAWFTPPDIWHAVDEGMLEVNLWHSTTANVAPGDELLDLVLNVFDKHGIPAHFDEGRIEIAARWQKRIALHVEPDERRRHERRSAHRRTRAARRRPRARGHA